MTSDDARHVPDRAFRTAGAGMAPMFLCPCCAKRKHSTGRRLLRVQGIRQWVCQQCVKARAA
jgi:hypothetical protein